MPLPDNPHSAGLAWPPAQLANITPKLQEWSAWYAGDANTLTRQYGGFGGTAPSVRARPSQFAGGAVGAIARMFWGAPQSPGQARTKLHMPVASDIATASSDLLFSEALKITLPEGAEAGQDRLQQLLDGNLWDSLLPEQGELNSALGGVYLRGVIDRDVVPDHPIADVVHADAAVPEFAYGRLRAVTFWQVIGRDGQRVQRLLERHEVLGGAGRIEYGLYEGTEEKLGRRVDFGGAEATRGLQVDQDSGLATGLPLLTAVYIPNMRPNKLWRGDPVGSALGRADIDGVEPLLDATDEALTSWMRDIRLGKGRIIVPNYMLQNNGVGRSSTFNIDQEVFTGLALPPAEEGGNTREMTVQQFNIRTAEHADTIKGLLSAIFRGAGYSAQTFGLPDESAATATEVTARERRSTSTREKKSRYYSDGLARFLRVLMALDTHHFGGGIGLDVLPKIEFPAAAQPSPEDEARTMQMLRAAGLLSRDIGIRMVHPDWDDPQVEEELLRLEAEDKANAPAILPDPFARQPGEEGGGELEPELPPDPAAGLQLQLEE
jgi:A118 family predicted phage portal protein